MTNCIIVAFISMLQLLCISLLFHMFSYLLKLDVILF